jgi:hypothetical protein
VRGTKPIPLCPPSLSRQVGREGGEFFRGFVSPRRVRPPPFPSPGLTTWNFLGKSEHRSPCQRGSRRGFSAPSPFHKEPALSEAEGETGEGFTLPLPLTPSPSTERGNENIFNCQVKIRGLLFLYIQEAFRHVDIIQNKLLNQCSASN